MLLLDITELESKGIEVVKMGHAYRLNGVVDLWFNGRTLYNKKLNEYQNFNLTDNLIDKALSIVEMYPKENSFKTTKKGNISYQQFRHNKKIHKAAYYHWDRNDSKSDDHLYFIKSGPHVKIGRSKNPKERMKSFMTALAMKPKLLHVVKNKGCLETTLHKSFKEHRMNGEWFNYHEDIQDFISYLKKI